MPNSQSHAAIETIEELQARYQGLTAKKIKVETQRDHAQEQLKQIKAQALEQFGSDDLETLKLRLAEMKKSNEQKRVEYQKQLDQIEQKLGEIDEQFVAAELDQN